MDVFGKVFGNEEPEFSRPKVNKLILMIRKGNSVSAEKSKHELFVMMKKIIVKNINNYLKMSRNSAYSDYTIECGEAISESYINLIQCTEKFNVDGTNCFYFYFNISLRRRFRRILEDERRDREGHDKFQGELQYLANNSHNKAYSEELVIEKMELDEISVMVLKSKIALEPKDDFIVSFMERFPDLNLVREDVESLYRESLKKIKAKLKIVAKDEPRFKDFLS